MPHPPIDYHLQSLKRQRLRHQHARIHLAPLHPALASSIQRKVTQAGDERGHLRDGHSESGGHNARHRGGLDEEVASAEEERLFGRGGEAGDENDELTFRDGGGLGEGGGSWARG
jgi:hypothetical protein